MERDFFIRLPLHTPRASAPGWSRVLALSTTYFHTVGSEYPPIYFFLLVPLKYAQINSFQMAKFKECLKNKLRGILLYSFSTMFSPTPMAHDT